YLRGISLDVFRAITKEVKRRGKRCASEKRGVKNRGHNQKKLAHLKQSERVVERFKEADQKVRNVHENAEKKDCSKSETKLHKTEELIRIRFWRNPLRIVATAGRNSKEERGKDC